MSPIQDICYQAVKHLSINHKEACTCVSGWCEGNLCPLSNPVKERITDGGITYYTSGGVPGRRKSGDTEGYSVRGAWSIEKSRAVFVVDICGGCGERGTSGSAAQRAALLLADGPPTTSTSCRADGDNEEKPPAQVLTFVGDAESHIYPSIVNLEVRLRTRANAEDSAMLSVSSTDGAGCTVTARPINNGWEYDKSVLYGCGFGGDDPLAKISQKRSLTFVDEGRKSAMLQEVGQDIYLVLRSTFDVFESGATQ